MFSYNKVLFGVLVLLTSQNLFAQSMNAIMTVPQAVPAISQAGLIGLGLVIGLFGAKLIKKYKK